jgi:hypothetical protein
MNSFHLFLIRPALGFCRGVLPYNLALLLPFLFFARECFAEGQEGCALAFMLCPVLVMFHEIAFRRSRLPQPVCKAYDALFSDVVTETISRCFSELIRLVLDQIAIFIHIVAERIATCFWFLVSLLLTLPGTLQHVLTSRTRPACDSISVRRYLLLTQTHSIRAPSFIL